MLNSRPKLHKNSIQMRVEHRLLKSHHSVSILQLIRQVRYINDHDNKADASIVTRSLVAKKAQQAEQYALVCPLVPKQKELHDKSHEVLFMPRAKSIQQIRGKCELEIVPESNTSRKVRLASPQRRPSIRKFSQRDYTMDDNQTEERERLNPILGKRGRGSVDNAQRDEMSRQMIAKKLQMNHRLTNLSRWNNAREYDDEPQPPY